jgi:putative ubiquitin-RnfH superfamily antitoxin RatB of RatAB toxin-antitoxin module
MPRTRLGTVFYLILVFASGILVGIVSYRLYDAKTVAATTVAPRTMEQYRKQFLSEMRQKVGTNEAQTEQINQVLQDTKRKLDILHAEGKPLRDKLDRERIESIRALLTDPQRAAYDQWRAEKAKAAEQQRLKLAQQK